MKNLCRLLSGLIIIFLSLILIAGCSPAADNETSESENESEKTEEQNQENNNGAPDDSCDEIRNELESVKSKYDELNSDHDELDTKYDEMDAKYRELEATYNKLKRDYDELRIDYNAVTQLSVDIEEGDIEQEIFNLINETRKNNGLNELKWTESLYWYANEHSNHMADSKTVELSDFSYWQAVASAAGYGTAEQLAIGMMRIWEESSSYENDFLNEHAKYGVVSVTRSGDVYYIIYLASIRE